MAPWDKPRPRRTNQGPVGRIRPSETNLGPTGRIRTPGRIEPRGMSQGPPEQLRACGTLSVYQGPGGRTRAPLTNQDPKGRIRTPRDRVGPRGTSPAQCFSMPSHSSKQNSTRRVRHFPTNQRRGFCRAALTPPTAETCS